MSSSNDASSTVFYSLLFGPVALVWGLRQLQKKRTIENLPSSKVRSAAMGPVEFKGTARQRTPLKSPLSKVDCCWWKCVVEELRSSGKHSRWETLAEKESLDFFFLQDDTGHVLVNPHGAELHVKENLFKLNSTTQTAIAPVLQGWGINPVGWFGGNRSLRIKEQVIPIHSPLYAMGELTVVRAHLEDRRLRLTEKLRAVKQNAAVMAQADINKDGHIDAEEWDRLRLEVEDAFLKVELSRQKESPETDTLLLKAPVDGHFLLSTLSEAELLKTFGFLTPIAIAGGVALCGFGAWMGLQQHWPLWMIAGAMAIGFCVSLFTKKKGVSIWLSFR